MYKTLMESMKERGITQRDLAIKIGTHYNTVGAKIKRSGRCDFSVSEARQIHKSLFPDMGFVELFEISKGEAAE